jgi:hypothetical protein
MKNYKVVYEIEVEAKNPLEAAKQVSEWLKENDTSSMFYVQEEDSTNVFSIDLEEEDEDAVLPVHCYHPLIATKE